jgi:hypothetical protein
MFPKFDLMKIYYQSSADGGDGAGADDKDETQDNNQGEPETLESYITTLPTEQQTKVKSLLDAHVEKLSNTVKATRQERDAFQRDLTAAIKKAEKGSELETQLTKLSSQLDEANRKSEFYEQAPQFECRNIKAAYAIATVNNLFTKSGAPDWKAIKEEAPEFFGKVSNGNPRKKSAGSGTSEEPVPTNSMNDLIRRSAGIRPS